MYLLRSSLPPVSVLPKVWSRDTALDCRNDRGFGTGAEKALLEHPGFGRLAPHLDFKSPYQYLIRLQLHVVAHGFGSCFNVALRSQRSQAHAEAS